MSGAADARGRPRSAALPYWSCLTLALATNAYAGPKKSAPPAKTEPRVAAPAEPSREPVAPKPEEKPPEPTTTPAPEAVLAAEATTPAPPAERPAMRLSVGGGGFNRGFSWSADRSPSLGTARQPFAASVAVDGTWYPGTYFTSGLLSNLGLAASGEFGVGMSSRLGAARYSSHASRLRFGALGRVPLGPRFELGAHVGYARHEVLNSTTALNDGTPRPNMPDVTFSGLRGGLDVRLRPFGTVELDAQASATVVTGLGELGSARYFPDARALAVDAGGGLSVELMAHLRLRAGAEWQRYFVTLHAADDATVFARSATDQYLAVSAQLQWVL